MTVIKPFRALRPVPEKARQVSCVPYDVADDREARQYIEENPLSFLRVTRPEALFTDDSNTPDEEIFLKARKNLERFIENGVYAREAEPGIYIYRLSTANHAQTGVVACCSLDEYELGIIKKHEATRPDKVADRTEHMLALRAQTGLILLAFRNTARIRRLISEAAQNKPIYDFVCASGIRQTIWEITRTEDFTEAFEEVSALYIADGHHRIESANLARKKISKNNSAHTGAEDYNFVVAGMFPAEDLRILAYNRVVKSLNGLSEMEFLEKLRKNFTVSRTDQKEPRKHGEICMFFGDEWYRLIFSAGESRESDPVARLDVSILQDYILHPVLGIEDPRTDERIGFVGGARGTAELEKLVAGGSAQVAFSLFPTTMDDLFAVSDTGENMPPKSTWFEPKLKDGLLVHLI